MRGLTCALSTAVLLAGCGGPERSAAGDPADDRRAVQERTVAYLSAFLGGDGERACAQLTPAHRRRQDARSREGGFRGCADAYEEIGRELFSRLPADDQARARAEYLRPERVRVELAGDRATAGFAAAEPGRIITRIALLRSGSRWLIAELGVKSRPQP